MFCVSTFAISCIDKQWHLLYTDNDVGWHGSTIVFILGAQNPGKEVGAMTFQLILNWKSFAALGAALIGYTLAKRVPAEQTANVLNHMFDTAGAVIGGNSAD